MLNLRMVIGYCMSLAVAMSLALSILSWTLLTSHNISTTTCPWATAVCALTMARQTESPGAPPRRVIEERIGGMLACPLFTLSWTHFFHSQYADL